MAHKDLKALANMLDATLFEDEIFGFHAQQAVEKAIKALLSFHGIHFPPQHDLRLLFRLADESGVELEESHHDLADLTPFAVQFRCAPYEGLDVGLDREQMLDRIRSFCDLIDRHCSQKQDPESTQ